eukprot:jgi/Tetstr1/440890/TSEL_029162.t1
MIRTGARIPFKSAPPAAFHQWTSMEDATHDRLRFMDGEMARLLVGAWRLIINLRPLNRYREERNVSFETLARLRYLARPGDCMLSMDLHDGFYAVGIAPENRDYRLCFTVDYRGKLYRLPRLPMGWSLSPYYFCSLTAAFNRHPRRPDFALTSQGVRRAKLNMGRRQAPRSHFRGCRMLPYMDEFMFFAFSRAHADDVRDRLTSLLGKLSHSMHPDTGLWEPDSRSGRVKMTHQLRHDLEWWVAVPNHNNGRSIYKPVETAYMHIDNYGYGRAVVLNATTEARGLWYDCDRELHITYNELKAVRYAVLTFLSELRYRKVLLHEDIMGVVHILSNLTYSRSPLLMIELRKL